MRWGADWIRILELVVGMVWYGMVHTWYPPTSLVSSPPVPTPESMCADDDDDEGVSEGGWERGSTGSCSRQL
ncbi:hypothetical protein BZA05DRAFT_389449 [Tricharina praecox]|uniref:uncharacterized protein n=1 Tax=Tricharina praecox TaxID=43433 RepID=UPI00221E4F39|nr:uncharacterized protein BZA05DRAFT_389449 [Tricharina praecox]KAI5855716.1 hypothetical protein BZA05DRAFT_389449 [Tricharina praecox]